MVKGLSEERQYVRGAMQPLPRPFARLRQVKLVGWQWEDKEGRIRTLAVGWRGEV